MTSLHDYHKSIGAEIKSAQNRIRSLLHPTIHWGEDGRYKEEVLKSVLVRHVPASLGVNSGFVRLREESTSQIDVLITDNMKPMLFANGDFCITTPSNVNAIVEVKSKINSITHFRETISALALNANRIRLLANEGKLTYSRTSPWSALFVYDKLPTRANVADYLNVLNEIADRDFHKIVNMICIGPDLFIRYWPQDNRWSAYDLKELAFSYFIGNLIWQDQPSNLDQEPWFALREGKGDHRIDSRNFEFERT